MLLLFRSKIVYAERGITQPAKTIPDQSSSLCVNLQVIRPRGVSLCSDECKVLKRI